jgi:hypothetical protein
MPAHADDIASPGATMSGLKRASIVGPLLENAARLFAEEDCPGIWHGLLQHVKQKLNASTAAQQSEISQDKGKDKQHRGRLPGCS